jgi:hypothetical protein
MKYASALIASTGLAAIATLSGCASQGNAGAVVTPASAPAPVADPTPDPAPSTSAACTTNACIASGLQKSLIGLVAKDNSVITAATCYKRTVKHNAGNTWTAECHVTYSDDSVYSGYATYDVAKNEVPWEPSEELQ